MSNIIIIFILGMLGTFIRVSATRYNTYALMACNVSGVILALIFTSLQFPLLVAGFCGSLTTLSSLIVIGEKDNKYLFLTVTISYVAALIVMYIL